MRPVVIAALLTLLAASATGCGGSKKSTASGGGGDECAPPASTISAGNAQIAAKAVGKGYAKLIVIHATDKQSGVPLHHAHVTVQAEMNCYDGSPHFMPLYEKTLRETSKGTYKGAYQLVMQGQWTINIILRAKNGEATTSKLPITMKLGG